MSSNEQENHKSNEPEESPVVSNEENQLPPNDADIDEENSNPEQQQIPARPYQPQRVYDPVREYMLQKQLFLIIHAQTCLDDQQYRNIPVDNCRVPFCNVKRAVLQHLYTCHQGLTCNFELCASSQLLLFHLKCCGQSTCYLCAGYVDFEALLDSPDPSAIAGSNPTARHPSNQQEAALMLQQILHSPDGIARWVRNSRNLMNLNWQLYLLLHADKCESHRIFFACPTPNCKEFRTALNHMPKCHNGRDCTFPYCWSSRKIINHWLICQLHFCPLCIPIRQMEGVQANTFFTSIAQSNRTQSQNGHQNHRNGLNPIPENDQGENPPGGNNASGYQGPSNAGAYHVPLGISVNNHYHQPAVIGTINPVPLLMSVSHGPSSSMGANSAGALHMYHPAQLHYQQPGLVFVHPNHPQGEDVSPPGVRVGSLPGYSPDDVSPPGMRVGSLPEYGPDVAIHPGSAAENNPEGAVGSAEAPQPPSDPRVNGDATASGPEMQELAETVTAMSLSEIEAAREQELGVEKSFASDDSINFCYDENSASSGSEFDPTDSTSNPNSEAVTRQSCPVDLEPNKDSELTVEKPKDCDQTTKSGPDEH